MEQSIYLAIERIVKETVPPIGKQVNGLFERQFRFRVSDDKCAQVSYLKAADVTQRYAQRFLPDWVHKLSKMKERVP